MLKPKEIFRGRELNLRTYYFSGTVLSTLHKLFHFIPMTGWHYKPIFFNKPIFFTGEEIEAVRG